MLVSARVGGLEQRVGGVVLTSCCVLKKEDLEAGVLGDGIYFSITTAFRYRGKGHLAYNLRILHGLYSLALSFPLPPLQGGWWAFKENPYNAQIMPRQANWTGKDMWLKD